MRKNSLLFALLSCAIMLSAKDVVVLLNEMKFEGEILKIRNCEVVFKASDGNKYHIPANDIYLVEFENPSQSKAYADYLELSEVGAELCLVGRSDAENFH